MSKPLKVGIIGTGAIGNGHASLCSKYPSVTITALCDIHEGRLQAVADAHAPHDERYSDYRKMLAKADVDAVFVCTPNYLHRPMSVAGLAAGKNVFCEKPMTVSLADAKRMVEAGAKARRKGQVLQIGMVWRQEPRALTIRHLIEAGKCGKIYHVRTTLIRRRGIPALGGWFTTRKFSGGGAVMDIGVHWIDVSMYLAGAWKPKTISAVNHAQFGPTMRDYVYSSMWAGPPDYNGTFDVEDYTTGLVRFAGGLSMSFNIGWAANGPDASFVELLGNKGGLIFSPGQGVLLRTTRGKQLADLPQGLISEEDCFVRQLRLFVAACRGKGKVPATPEQGLAVVKVLRGICDSARAGREITVR
jgi:predicted dehydrogenase